MPEQTAPSIENVLPAAPPGRKTALLGEIVVELGHASEEAVEQAVADARAAGRPIGEWLADSGAISDDQLAEALAYRFGVDHVHLSNFAVDMAAANLIAPDVAKRLEAVPVGFVGESTLVVAMRDPANVVAIDDMAMLTGYSVRPAVATRDDIQGLIARLDRFSGSVEEDPDEDDVVDVADLARSAGNEPVIKLVNSIIAQAVELGASDSAGDRRDPAPRPRARPGRPDRGRRGRGGHAHAAPGRPGQGGRRPDLAGRGHSRYRAVKRRLRRGRAK